MDTRRLYFEKVYWLVTTAGYTDSIEIGIRLKTIDSYYNNSEL